MLNVQPAFKAPRKFSRALEAAEKTKYLKRADVNIGAGEKGLHTSEVFQRRSSPFHVGTQVKRETYSDPMGRHSSTVRRGTAAHLTPLGRKTRDISTGVGAVGLYGGLVVHESRRNKQRSGVAKNMSTVSIWGVEHGEEIAKADLSTYRQREWTKPHEQKKINRARAKNAGLATGAAGLGVLAAGRGRRGTGALAGLGAASLGSEIGSNSAKLEPTLNKPAHRYLKAGGTDKIAGVNW